MISAVEALKRVKEITYKQNVIEIALADATGYVLAEDCFSEISFPSFNQSAMDGYAINYQEGLMKYTVISEIKAGDSSENSELKKGEACRIFTGAMLPLNTLIVVKQEDVDRIDNEISVNKPIALGDHIRLKGEQINVGELAATKYTLLNPGAIGFLSMIGIEKVSVFQKPKITVIATGNELVKSGGTLLQGQIFESNTNTLISALSVFGFTTKTNVVEDSYDLIKETIEKAFSSSDLVIVTGGISVGDYDFVGKILVDLKVHEVFYKVAQKPGKPLFFGMKGEVPIFALPGNPAAVLTSFYIYVLPVLGGLTGRKTDFLSTRKVKLNNSFDKTPNLSFFLKGRVENDAVTILTAQSSAMLSSFIEANCIVCLEEGKTHWNENDFVDIIVI
jgi:molybdopterin molybdotransferase